MAKHLHTGRRGEELAAAWLQQKGYVIRHRNWKFSYYELDIVAEKNGMLHFIEVKTRRNNRFGHPEESVSKKKLQRLYEAGAAYQEAYPGFKWVQYHILSILLLPQRPPEFYFLEDVSM
ncbi:MAG: YraN family protein [Lacibacter sp.]